MTGIEIFLYSFNIDALIYWNVGPFSSSFILAIIPSALVGLWYFKRTFDTPSILTKRVILGRDKISTVFTTIGKGAANYSPPIKPSLKRLPKSGWIGFHLRRTGRISRKAYGLALVIAPMGFFILTQLLSPITQANVPWLKEGGSYSQFVGMTIENIVNTNITIVARGKFETIRGWKKQLDRVYAHHINKNKSRSRRELEYRYWKQSGRTFGTAIGYYFFDSFETLKFFLIGVPGILFLLTITPFVWIIIAASVKRLHDRGKSGSLVLLPLLFTLMSHITYGVTKLDLSDQAETAAITYLYIPLILLLLASLRYFIESLLFKGTDGENQYGGSD